MKIGLLGYGYSAGYFAQRLVRKDYQIWGTRRDPAAVQAYDDPAVTLLPFDYNAIIAALTGTAGLLISAPPLADGQDPVLALLADELIKHQPQLRWVGYLSTTGVYGDHQGQWVDETSPCKPAIARDKNRLKAETAWLSLCESHGIPVMVFRLAGIYGPKRNAIERLQAGNTTTVVKPDQYFSRIHVYDIAAALYNSLSTPQPGEVINLCDDLPCNSFEPVNYAAQLLGVEQPQPIPYEDAELSPMAEGFYRSNKRVSNAKLKQQLLPQLRYPSYKEGLTALISGEPL